MKTQHQKEIADIKQKQRELADRLEALEQEPEVKPQAGEVWERSGFTYHINGCNGKRMASVIAGPPFGFHFGVLSENWKSPEHLAEKFKDATRLGTFDEVYVERAELEKDYVSKEALTEAIAECRRAGRHGFSTRSHISRKFDINY